MVSWCYARGKRLDDAKRECAKVIKNGGCAGCDAIGARDVSA